MEARVKGAGVGLLTPSVQKVGLADGEGVYLSLKRYRCFCLGFSR